MCDKRIETMSSLIYIQSNSSHICYITTDHDSVVIETERTDYVSIDDPFEEST